MSNLSLRERDAVTIAQIGKLRFSPLSVVGGKGDRLIEEGGRSVPATTTAKIIYRGYELGAAFTYVGLKPTYSNSCRH